MQILVLRGFSLAISGCPSTDFCKRQTELKNRPKKSHLSCTLMRELTRYTTQARASCGQPKRMRRLLRDCSRKAGEQGAQAREHPGGYLDKKRKCLGSRGAARWGMTSSLRRAYSVTAHLHKDAQAKQRKRRPPRPPPQGQHALQAGHAGIALWARIVVPRHGAPD